MHSKTPFSQLFPILHFHAIPFKHAFYSFVRHLERVERIKISFRAGKAFQADMDRHVKAVHRALYIAALASIAVILTFRPTQQPFPLVFDKAKALALSESLDKLLGLSGETKILFFEVRTSSVCAASALGLPSLASCRGKEWVVRTYKGEALAYELRVDATLGFSYLLANLSLVDLERAITAAAELLNGSKPGLYNIYLEGNSLSVSAWEEMPEVCTKAQDGAAQWSLVSTLVSVGLHAILIAGLIVAVALDTPGLSKRRAVAVVLPILSAAAFTRTLLSVNYTLGRRSLAPTLRNIVNLLYSDALLALFSLISLLAGAAVAAKRGAVSSFPSGRRLAGSWLAGAVVGVLLTASSAIAFFAAARAGFLLPLSDPLLEQAFSSKAAWAELAVSTAVSAIAVESLFRYLLLHLLVEVTGSWGQAVVLESAIYALSYSGYPLYPPYAKVLQALAVAVALSLLVLSEGLAAAVFANFTFNAVSSAVALYPIFPLDAAILLSSVVGALPLSYLLLKLTKLAFG